MVSPKESPMLRLLSIAFSISLMAQVPATAPRPARPTPPTRDPNTPGYVTAKDLPDGANAPVNADGNFILGPTHTPAPEVKLEPGVPQRQVIELAMNSTD